MKISIVLSTYNRRDLLARTLPTVFNQDFPADQFEVIVVVDGSTDGTVEFLRSCKPACPFQVLEQPNRGLAAARNAGVRAAHGEWVLFLDDDILCDRRLVREHAAAHQSEEPAVILGALPMASESPASLATDWMGAETGEFLDSLTRGGEAKWPQHIFVPPNSSVPRSVLLATGGFDESLALVRLDFELGFRLYQRGVRFRYEPKAVAHHFYHRRAREVVRRDSVWFGKGEVVLSQKYPEYRAHSPLAKMGGMSGWKRAAMGFAARFPLSPDPLIAAPFWLAERFRSVPAVRRVGVGLMRTRCRIQMLRGAVREKGSWSALQREFGMRLSVLLYHHVGPLRQGTYKSLTILPAQFEEHVRWLRGHGYRGIRPSDFLAWRRQGKALPTKPVLLTFDDAYADLAEHALPVLKRYGFGAGVFVVTSQMGGTNTWDEARGSGTHRLMTAEQIRHWAAQGIEFGSHGHRHVDLTTLSEAELADEVKRSAEELEKVSGAPPTAFAYPYGRHNETVRRHVSGRYGLAFTGEEGMNHLRRDPYALYRTMVQPGDDLMDLRFRVRRGWSPVQHLKLRLVRAMRTEQKNEG